jgi:hypothetical protein
MRRAIPYVAPPKPLQEFYVTLDNENLLLLKGPFQFLFELPQKTTSGTNLDRYDTINNDLIPVCDVTHLPEAFSWLRAERKPIEIFQEANLKILELARFHRGTIVVT